MSNFLVSWPRSAFARTRRLPISFFIIAIFSFLALLLFTVQDLPSDPSVSLKGWRDRTAEQWNIGSGNKCKGWDPELPEDMDPEDCLRAKQYRQTQRVLAREIEAKHGHWHFTNQHNINVLGNLSLCFLPLSHPDYKSCPPKPLILSGWWYTAEVVTAGTSGEVIWQTGVMKQVEALGLYWIAVGPYENWITVAEMMPDVYRSLWNRDIDIVSCITDPRCVKYEHYTPPIDGEDLSIGVPPEERGVIPIWMLNVVDYWGCFPKGRSNNRFWWNVTGEGDWSFQPLGKQWIAIPWRLPGHVHLPYSIEDKCMPLPTTPWAEREENALIFAKKSSYFDIEYLSPKKYWTDLANEPGFNLLSTAALEEGHPLPDGLETLGKQSREDYGKLVGSVKVLLGMGNPRISPSVWTALCQGTPVVVAYWREKLPELKDWDLFDSPVQHGPAMVLGEPYVYSYYSKNYTDLVTKVRTALTTPIERYIPPDMRWDFALEETRKYVDRDLEAMFNQVLAENNGKIPKMEANVRERCIALKRCHPGYGPGKITASAKGEKPVEVEAEIMVPDIAA